MKDLLALDDRSVPLLATALSAPLIRPGTITHGFTRRNPSFERATGSLDRTLGQPAVSIIGSHKLAPDVRQL